MIIPEKLIQSLRGVMGFDEDRFIDAHTHVTPITSIRLNSFKLTAPEFAQPLSDRVPWSSFGYYLSQRPSFTLDPLFHAGTYYVQEASGMFLEQAVKQTIRLSESLRVLDCCAAPGGKSTLLQSLISPGSLLVSNEVIKSRVSVLKENIVKWGAGNVVVSNNDPADFSRLENYFDLVVVDAPCSGSGLFRRDENAISEWSEDAVQHCKLRQQRILADIWPCLKQEGIFIYCTCSYSPAENEEVLDWLSNHFAVDSLRLTIDESWGIAETRSVKNGCYGYRFFPGNLQGEGFFIAALQKKDGGPFIPLRKKKSNLEKLSRQDMASVTPWIEQPDEQGFFKHDCTIHSMPRNLIDELAFIQPALYIKKAGVAAGKTTGTELIPDHQLALSTSFNRSIPPIDFSFDDALRYLRREEVKVETTLKGWALARYRSQNLGWVKVLANRINNYYPKEYRILKRSE